MVCVSAKTDTVTPTSVAIQHAFVSLVSIPQRRPVLSPDTGHSIDNVLNECEGRREVYIATWKY